MKHRTRFFAGLALLGLMLVTTPAAAEDEKYEQLQAQVEALQEQLREVQEALAQYASKTDTETQVNQLKQDIAEAAAWKEPNTLIHMAGYADVGYTKQDSEDGSFGIGTFSPIFHFQYRDLVMLEAEMEISVNDEGETDTALEYLTVDYFLNDYMTLVGGKFLSPIGQFRQNLHPSWINKLVSAPPGFGHDGAAPVSDLGVQARGGFKIGDTYANYAAFVSNGPELISAFEDGEFELGGVEAEAFGSDRDGDKVFGGRFAWLPTPGLELGFSLATGKASVTSIEEAHGEEPDEHEEEPGDHEDEPGDEHDEEEEEHDEEELLVDFGSEPARDYDVYGFDVAWNLNNFLLRGEFVKTKVGADNVGVTASPGATWQTWYGQASYLIPQTNWETAIRYTDFDSAHSSESQKQWAFGVNYLFASSVIGKFTYEFNDGLPGSVTDANRWLFQLAYGF
ncbi:hypothetical protein [Elongatibacter sediminis]|uniref:Porin n=1 Tax=Elongatibacter sediminis TaxID=3119006 RepID=A0AAW9RA83_9GAMM